MLAQVGEQLMYLHTSSTLDPQSKTEFLRRFQKVVRTKVRASKAAVVEKVDDALTIVRPATSRAMPSSPVVQRRSSHHDMWLLEQDRVEVEAASSTVDIEGMKDLVVVAQKEPAGEDNDESREESMNASGFAQTIDGANALLALADFK